HLVAAFAAFEMPQTITLADIHMSLYGYNTTTLSSTNINWLDATETGFESFLYGGRLRMSNPAFAAQREILHRYVSAFANGGYTYDGRYNLTGSIRVDQADLFGVDPKYKYRALW